jgi:hypothetical protein
MAAKKLPKITDSDIGFAITSGYYPKIASSIAYKRGAGLRGSSGAKHRRVKGWSKYSIDKAEFQKPEGWTKPLTTKKGFYRKEITAHRRAMFEAQRLKPQLLASGKMGKAKLPKMSDRAIKRNDQTPSTDKEGNPWKWGAIENYQWIGGSDEYKLFGDQVWYMHGKSSNKILTDYVEGFSKGQFGAQKIAPAFQNVYSSTEKMSGGLVDRAMEMAKTVFKEAVKDSKFEEAIEKTVKGDMAAMSAEEIGYTEGDYTYMPYKTAWMAKGDDDLYRFRDKMDAKVKGSHAEVRDIVKINNMTQEIEDMFDVTEMPLGKKGQHGIVQVPETLKTSIKEAIKAGEGGSLKRLRVEVEQMFIKAIKNDYNPTIRRLKERAQDAYEFRTEIGANPLGGAPRTKTTSMQQIINEVKIAQAGKKVSVPDLAAFAGMKLAKNARQESWVNAYSETGLRYITHMLATWGDKLGNKYTQAHRVGDFEDGSGRSIFAYTKMHQFASGNRVMEFSESAPKGKKGTWLLTGYSATLALEESTNHNFRARAGVTSLQQKRAFMWMRVMGHPHTKMGHTVRAMKQHPGVGPQRATQIFMPQPQAINEFLQRVLDGAVKHAADSGSQLSGDPAGVKTTMEKNAFSYNMKKKRVGGTLRRGGEMNAPGFWALPYVGLMTTEHIDRPAPPPKKSK